MIFILRKYRVLIINDEVKTTFFRMAPSNKGYLKVVKYLIELHNQFTFLCSDDLIMVK